MANAKKTVDRAGNEINSLEESMHYISCRLDELSGCAMANSYLNVSVSDLEIPETDLTKVEEALNSISVSLADVSNDVAGLDEIRSEIGRLNDTNELILMQLSRIADALEKK
jgi:archaellum component FlaC